jgi:O-antigen/teichoic acid export membrane protein
MRMWKGRSHHILHDDTQLIDYFSRLWDAVADLFSAFGRILVLLIGGIGILLAVALWLWALWFCFFEKEKHKRKVSWDLLFVQVILAAALFGLPAGSTHHSYLAFFAGTSIGLVGWVFKVWRFGFTSGTANATEDQQASGPN